MEIIEIQTLVDITNSRVYRANQGTQQQLDQTRNFTTLSQCIEIRSIVLFDNYPTMKVRSISGSEFGYGFTGTHAVWTFRFTPDRMGVYTDDKGNEIGSLIEDIDQVPIIKNLTETINIDKAMFELTDKKFRNTIIKYW